MLRWITGAELDRYFEEEQRAYYVWCGSPYGLEEEDFQRWFKERCEKVKEDGEKAS